MPHPQATPQPPQIAIVMSNTLAALGLSQIIGRMMPHARLVTYAAPGDLPKEKAESFFHFFISPEALTADAPFFRQYRHKTIVLVRGETGALLPDTFHCINICRPEEELVRDFLRLAEHSHAARGGKPQAVREAEGTPPASESSVLTPREREVLRLVVAGYINKEIADRLAVSLTTVISHRKNLTEKLGIKSVSALTVYAVTRGLISVDEI